MNRMKHDPMRMTRGQRTKRRVLVFWGVLLLLATLIYRTLLQSFELPPQGYRLKVPRGSSWAGVAEQLSEQNLITSALSLRIWLLLRPGEEVLRSGVFVLRPPMTLDQLVQRLAEAPDGTQPLVLIEGERFQDLRKKLADRDDVRQAMKTLSNEDVLRDRRRGKAP